MFSQKNGPKIHYAKKNLEGQLGKFEEEKNPQLQFAKSCQSGKVVRNNNLQILKKKICNDKC